MRSAELGPKIASRVSRSWAFAAAISAEPASSGEANVLGPVSEGADAFGASLQATSGRNIAKTTAFARRREGLVVRFGILRFGAVLNIAILPVGSFVAVDEFRCPSAKARSYLLPPPRKPPPPPPKLPPPQPPPPPRLPQPRALEVRDCQPLPLPPPNPLN